MGESNRHEFKTGKRSSSQMSSNAFKCDVVGKPNTHTHMYTLMYTLDTLVHSPNHVHVHLRKDFLGSTGIE